MGWGVGWGKLGEGAWGEEEEETVIVIKINFKNDVKKEMTEEMAMPFSIAASLEDPEVQSNKRKDLPLWQR